MIRAVKIGDKNGFLLTKAGLALGAGVLGAVVMGVVVGWVALNNTHSLSNEDRELVTKLENVYAYQKNQIAEAREANCKLKLYDVLSGKAGTLLFKKVHVLNKFFEKGISHTLEIVESIPSEKNCTGIFTEPKGREKKQTGGLTPSDIKYANEILGEIIQEPRGFQKRNEAKVKKNMERNGAPKKNKIPSKKKTKNPSSEQIKTPSTSTTTNAPLPPPVTTATTPVPLTPPNPVENKNCIVEISILDKELKVCS